jgi:hypothetical protein
VVGLPTEPEELNPVEHVEISRARRRVDASIVGEAPPRALRNDVEDGAAERLGSSPEASAQQADELRPLLGGEQRRDTPADRQHARIDRRWRFKRQEGDVADQAELPPGQPAERSQCARPDRGSLPSHLVLNQDVGSREGGAGIVEQMSQDGRGQGEGNVPERAKRHLGQRQLEDVPFDDFYVGETFEPTPKPSGEVGVELYGHHATGLPGKSFGDPADPRADLDHDIVLSYGCLLDQLRREPAAS